MDKYKLSLKKGEAMKKIKEKKLQKGTAVNAEIKKEEEKKMKKFDVVGGLKNVWTNHKNGFKNVAILGLGATCLFLALRGPKVEVRYEQLPPVIIREEVPVEPEQQEEAKDTTERN